MFDLFNISLKNGMQKITPDLHQHISLPIEQLLIDGEVILIVDDDKDIREILKMFFEEHGLVVVEAGSAAEMLRILDSCNVALALLDIGLPDSDGMQLLPELVAKYSGLSVVMLTGIADLQVAMECIRKGADDYMSKPVQLDEILFVVRKVLERRRLVFENLKYQADLEKAHFRIQMLHQLSLKMNTAYLSTVELDDILRAVLVGTTAEEGLRFNRAFLALFDGDGEVLSGRMAIGSHCRDQAGRIWAEMRERNLSFLDIVHNIRESCGEGDIEINRMIRGLKVSISDVDHVLIRASRERRSILVTNGQADVPLSGELMTLLGNDTFVVVPLYSPGHSVGVIIADNFVNRQPISKDLVSILELFASQASLAIEQSRLYMDMQNKIRELEDLTQELDKNKDLLVQAERYSALGQMSAQLVHAIRNPITSIGGVARLMAKRIKDEEWQKFIKMMIKETSRLEETLADLFDFVNRVECHREPNALYPLIRKTVMLVQPSMARQNIVWKLELPEPDPVLNIDAKQIRQVLLHLVKNSIEAMPDGGTLVVSVRPEDGMIRIRVADTGIGIQDASMEKVSDPFFTTKTYGTGLGLSLVEQIVQAHEGVFVLCRREEGGTEALVDLPIKSGNEQD